MNTEFATPNLNYLCLPFFKEQNHSNTRFKALEYLKLSSKNVC
jgi:hypothetical protein